MTDDLPGLKDRVKSLSDIETHRAFSSHAPIIVTAHGHDLFEDPKTLIFHHAMSDVVGSLAVFAQAAFAHTAGDRFYLILTPHGADGVVPFYGGNVQRVISGITARASVMFDRILQSPTWDDMKDLPRFDVQAWSVFVEEDVVDFVRWEASVYQTNLLRDLTQGRVPKGSKNEIRRRALVDEGTPLTSQPDWFTRGTYFQRRTLTAPFTPEERERLPPRHQAHRTPDAPFTRDVLKSVGFPQYPSPVNLKDVIFRGADPILRTP